ncbi:MAG TPA: hypothetical protein DHV36_06485 [Desulfobacteraceae bacterium]|nr:hypothetical protein [Desulfobacteraceae bacterium]
MKKQIAIVTATFLIVGFTASISQAGAARRHTIEGALIGAGAVILGSAIINSMNRPERASVVVKEYHHPPKPRYVKRYAKKAHRKGHWETRKTWVEPEYETRWNPGHYNRRGKWVAGRYEEFKVADGYWRKDKVWVRHGRGHGRF